MGGAACPLHDPGNDRSIERGSDLQAARRGSLTTPAKPAGERESDAALTPRSGTRSRAVTATDSFEPDSSVVGPRVRIPFPPAASQQRTARDAHRDIEELLACRCGGGRMIIIETFAGGCQPKHHP